MFVTSNSFGTIAPKAFINVLSDSSNVTTAVLLVRTSPYPSTQTIISYKAPNLPCEGGTSLSLTRN